MSIHRKCDSHQGSYTQRGRGVGGVLRSLYNQVIPIAKSTGEKLLASPEAKATLDSVKNAAIDAGINIVVDKISKRNSGKSVKKHATTAKHEIADALKTSVRNVVKRKMSGVLSKGGKSKRMEQDVFDDNSLDEEEFVQ